MGLGTQLARKVKETANAALDATKKEIQAIPARYAESAKSALDIPADLKQQFTTRPKIEAPNWNELNPARIVSMATDASMATLGDMVKDTKAGVRHARNWVKNNKNDSGAKYRDDPSRLDTDRASALQNLEIMWAPAVGDLATTELQSVIQKLEQGTKDFEFLQQACSKVAVALDRCKNRITSMQQSLQKEYNTIHAELADGTWNTHRDFDDSEKTPDKPAALSKAEVLRRYATWNERVKGDYVAFQAELEGIYETSRASITQLATEAFLVANPTTRMKRAKAACEFADYGTQAIGAAGGVLGKVPEGHCQAAGKALNLANSLLIVLKAFGDKAVKEIVLSVEVGDFEEKYGKGGAFARLNADPTAVANLLTDRMCDTVKLCMVLATPLITLVDECLPDLPPPLLLPSLAGIWDQITKVAVDATREHGNNRIAAARATMAQNPGQVATAKEPDADAGFWSTVTAPMYNGLDKALDAEISSAIKPHVNNVAAALKDNAISLATGNPEGFVMDMIRVEVITPVVRRIMKKLPVTPAQLVTGDDMEELIANARASLASRGMRIAQPEAWRPEADRNGVPMRLLSATLDDDEHRVLELKYYLAEVDGADVDRMVELARELGDDLPTGRGRLYVLAGDDEWDLKFVPESEGGPSWREQFAAIGNVPSKTSSGRSISEIIPATNVPAGAQQYKVRIDDLWGYLDRSGSFGADEVYAPAFADWRKRVIVAAPTSREPVTGYRDELGEFHPGAWVKPLPKRPQTFLFIPEDGGLAARQWANGTTPVGNAKIKFVYQAFEKASPGDFDISTIVS